MGNKTFKTVIVTRAGEKIVHLFSSLAEACADADTWEAGGHDANVTKTYFDAPCIA